MTNLVKEYDTRVDSKKRITLRGAVSDYYHVKERADGTIELSPRVLVHPEEISAKTLAMLDRSVENLKKGVVSDPIDLSTLKDLNP